MTSIFSFLRSSSDTTGESSSATPLASPATAVAPARHGPTPHGAAPARAPSHAPSTDDVLAGMLTQLQIFLPPAAPPAPAPDVTVVSVTEKLVGVGNLIGYENANGFTAVAHKGGRLLTVVRFQLWATTPTEVGALGDALHGRLLAAKLDLQLAGFIKMGAQGSLLPVHVAPLNVWRKTLDYQFLYEYRYVDSDGAESLIARIPVHTDPETLNSEQRETEVVTDALVRWDNETALPLNLAGQTTIGQLSALVFVPGAIPTGTVTLVRTFAGATVPPAIAPTFAAWSTAVGPTLPGVVPNRNIQFTFATFSDFLAAFAISSNAITLGDWDQDSNLDNYQTRQLIWASPIHLTAGVDRLQIIYQLGSTEPRFDQVAIMYLRARR